MIMENNIRFNRQFGPASEDDYLNYKNDYGLDFCDATRETEVKIIRNANRMVKAATTLFPGHRTPRVLNYYLPEIVLSAPLSDQDRLNINRRETAIVAKKTVDAQKLIDKVPIVDCLEGFDDIIKRFHDSGVDATFSDKPFHEACGEWAGKRRVFWARSGFVDRLVVMGSILNSINLSLHFEDAFRPVGVQEGLFRRRLGWTKERYPDWSIDKVLEEAKSKTAVKPRLASHKAGAAADLRLRLDGAIVDFGHEYPDGGAIVYPLTPFITGAQCFNRQMLNIASQISGLTMYMGEDWHVSYGDNLASIDASGNFKPDYVAKYGPVKSFDPTTGVVVDVYSEDEMGKIFDY